MNEEQWGPGKPETWKFIGKTYLGSRDLDTNNNPRSGDLILGSNRHSVSENNMYMKISNDREPIPFNGSKILLDLKFTTHNYLKESYLSGDEIRKGGNCEIFANFVKIYEFFYRDVKQALISAQHIITKLEDLPIDYIDEEARTAMVGRKIFYHNQPAIIKRVLVDQGCIIVQREDGIPFSFPYMEEDNDEDEITVKDDILSPHIWWFRGDNGK